MCASSGEKEYLAHVMKKQSSSYPLQLLTILPQDSNEGRGLGERGRTWFVLLWHFTPTWLSIRGRALGGGSDPLALIRLLPLNSCILRTHFRVSIHEGTPRSVLKVQFLGSGAYTWVFNKPPCWLGCGDLQTTLWPHRELQDPFNPKVSWFSDFKCQLSNKMLLQRFRFLLGHKDISIHPEVGYLPWGLFVF